MNTLSVVIITQDESRNIRRCLESVKDIADEVVVVDSGSTDDTEAICRAYGARFEYHKWAGYSGQKNYADSLATGEWIFSIDADEALSPQLLRSIVAVKSGGDEGRAVAYRVKRLTNHSGSWVRHCGWYPDAKVRIFRRGAAQWNGVVHEELDFAQATDIVTLDGDLYHYSYYNVEEHAARQVRYGVLAGEKAYAGGKRCGAASVVLKPLFTFMRDYLLRGGFLDGYMGLVVCRLNAHYTFVKYAKLRELCQK